MPCTHNKKGSLIVSRQTCERFVISSAISREERDLEKLLPPEAVRKEAINLSKVFACHKEEFKRGQFVLLDFTTRVSAGAEGILSFGMSRIYISPFCCRTTALGACNGCCYRRG